jgi:hypothetical protein
MRRLIAQLDTADRLTFGGVGLQALGFALLPLSLAALGLIVPGLWITLIGLLLGRKGEAS